MNLSDDEREDIAKRVADRLEAKRDKRIALTPDEVKDLKHFVNIKNGTIRGLIWIGAILAAVAIKDIWEFFWSRLTH